MTEQTLTFASFYQGWDGYQKHLIDVIAPLSEEQLALSAAPHLRSIGLNAAHIIGARAGWFSYVLKEGQEKLATLDAWDEPGQPARSAAELVSGLEITWQVLQQGLQRWTGADLEEIFYDTNEAGEQEALTRQWVIWHLIEHDLHHGGEISFTLGMHGLAAIDL